MKKPKTPPIFATSADAMIAARNADALATSYRASFNTIMRRYRTAARQCRREARQLKAQGR